MFYCTDCADQHEWPKTFFQSYGMCEMCDAHAPCHDMPASHLPAPRTLVEQAAIDDIISTIQAKEAT